MSIAHSEYSPEPARDHHPLTESHLHRAIVSRRMARVVVESIVAINRAWSRIDRQYDATALAEHGVDLSNLDVFRTARGPAAQGYCEQAGGARMVQGGSQSQVALECPYHEPTWERQFLRQAAPVPSAQRGAVVSLSEFMDQRRLHDDQVEDVDHLDGIFEAMRDGVVLCDKMGRIVHTNSAFRAMVGLDLDLHRHPAASVTRWSDGAQLPSRRDVWDGRLSAMSMPIRRALRGEVLAGETAVDVRIRAFDGRELEVNVSAAPIRDATGRVSGCVVVAQDLTEARLRAGAARVAALSREVVLCARERDAVFEAIPDGVLLYSPGGRLLQANTSARVLLDVDATETAGADAGLARVAERLEEYARYDAEGRPIPRETWHPARVLRGEAVTRHETADITRRLPDGREQVLSVRAAPIYSGEQQQAGAVLLLRDVTEQRRLEREAAERACQIEVIFEAMADGLAVYDADGRIVRMNAAYQRLLGLDAAEELAALTLRDRGQQLVPHDLQGHPLPEAQRPLYRILHGETLSDQQAVDLRSRSADGHMSEVSVSGAPLRDESGRIIGAVASLRDVTAQRRSEAERAHMLSTVSHELKNPLNILRLGLDLIQRSTERGAPAKLDTLELLDTGVTLMDRLVTDLVDAARMEAGHLVLRLGPTDLAALARRVAKEQMALEGRSVTVEAPARLLHATVDATRIAQVVTNLLSNANKYSPPDARVRLRLYRKQRQVYFEVHDEGVGIPPEAREHIFERFYRVPGVQVLHGVGVGLGLGLYICRGLVELHGGRIGVASESGHGSTFWFSLPLTRIGA